MARVFISHSSLDEEQATEIKTWLEGRGFEQIFLDFDKHAGIGPGADWERTLYREIERTQALIVILTPNWHESKWCFAEFTQARALGKAIFPVIASPGGDKLIAPDIQHLDITGDREGGLERLARSLSEIALDAQGQFEWDASRPPYPGLLSFEEADAAIYFGRDDDIRAVIERLNARRVQGGNRLIALLGASGSGKSSLMRAGVLPRLKRDTANWIVLPPFRPQARPLDEFARALALALGKGTVWRQLRDEFKSGDFRNAVGEAVHDLRTAHDALGAQILVTIDQAEELLGAVEPEEQRRFFESLNHMLDGDLPVIVVMALRSDYLGRLQTQKDLTARFDEISLKPMPLERIQQIIRGPAQVAGLRVDDDLIARATEDAETEDALPLLAFALRELFDRFGRDGDLTLREYEALGDPAAGLTPLENAVRRAADYVIETTGPSEEDLRALREAFVPAMVRVNAEGEFVRRAAHWSGLPPRAHVLLDRLAKARLLVARQHGGEAIIEVAHEALLRKWPRLSGWLNEEKGFLIGKSQLERDVADWSLAPPDEKPSALLTGLKLNRAESWLIERPQQLSDEERAFVAASVAKVRAGQARRARTRHIVTWGSVAAAFALCVTAWWAYGVYVERGAIRTEAARTNIRGQIVAFATAKGQFALDTIPGRKTSPYTSALLVALANKDRSVLTALTALNQQVVEASQGAQRPFLATSMNGNVYLWKQPETRKRMAMVVSVDDMGYGTERLVAPKHDADAYTDLLREIGLADSQIVRLHNPDRQTFLKALARALDTLTAERSRPGVNMHAEGGVVPNMLRPALEHMVIPAGIKVIEGETQPDATPETGTGSNGSSRAVDTVTENSLFLLYFSGNGRAISDGSFLIMESDRPMQSESDLMAIGVKLDRIVTTVSKSAAASILILDTNFPYAFSARDK